MGLFKTKYERELDMIMTRLDMNMSNNYKDNAQSDLKELDEALEELKNTGKLKPAILDKYESLAEDYRQRLKGYSHKDQKPYWH